MGCRCASRPGIEIEMRAGQTPEIWECGAACERVGSADAGIEGHAVRGLRPSRRRVRERGWFPEPSGLTPGPHLARARSSPPWWGKDRCAVLAVLSADEYTSALPL